MRRIKVSIRFERGVLTNLFFMRVTAPFGIVSIRFERGVLTNINPEIIYSFWDKVSIRFERGVLTNFVKYIALATFSFQSALSAGFSPTIIGMIVWIIIGVSIRFERGVLTKGYNLLNLLSLSRLNREPLFFDVNDAIFLP